MWKKHLKLILSISLGFIAILIAAFMFNVFTKIDSATKTFDTYKSMWAKNDFKNMYAMLSVKTKEKITETQFVDKYTNIYKGIEAKSISIKVVNEDKIEEGKKETITIPFSISMGTAAGQLDMAGYQANMVKEKVNNKNKWTIEWDEKMIFPKMQAGDKVRITPELATRGEIYDRDGSPLAKNTDNDLIVTIGIEPIRFVKSKDTNISQLAKILDIDASIIENKLKGNETSNQFTPIVNILSTENVKIKGVMELEGVIQIKPKGRVYPGGEAFGSLIGYIRPITAEELEKSKSEGYSSTSLIGKAGLEQVYEKRLRGENGTIIYISKQKDGKVDIILKKNSKAGEDIKLSVDIELQKKIYAGMNKEAGASAAINPKTGEVLALVSSPSYDSNAYTTYISNTQKAIWKSGKSPTINRFKAAYSPGSTFKLITAAIGLEQGTIKPSELISIQGNQWQLDKSWGPNKVTRVGEPRKLVNLQDAFVYSDNIYFAMAALKIGSGAFIKGSSKFGIGEKLPIDYPIANSQVANDNNIKNDVALADTGYGQGQVLMSPLQVALSYSAVVNNGNIMSPLLESFNTKITSKVWKANAISVDSIKFIKDSLTAVIENPNGTGNKAKINGIALAGKTGTAELKKNPTDNTAEENGWFVCMDTASPKIVIAMLMEDVKTKGGSHYVVPIVKGVMEYYLNKAPK